MCVWRSAKFKSIPLWIERVLSREGSIASDHRCSPERRAAQERFQSSSWWGEGKAVRFPGCSRASLPVRYRPPAGAPYLHCCSSTSHRRDVGRWGRWGCLVPSIVLVNGDLGGQFTMTLCGHLSRVWLFAAPSTVAYQTPLSMEFPRRGYWSGLPCPSLGDLPNPGIEPGIEPVSLMSFALADMFFTTSATSKPNYEVGVAQILGMKKEWALINKSFEHLQYWTVPALKKLTVNLYHGRVIILSSPLTISSRSWEYYSIFTWLHVGNKKKGSSFFSAPSFANLFSVFLQSQSIKYAHDIN